MREAMRGTPDATRTINATHCLQPRADWTMAGDTGPGFPAGAPATGNGNGIAVFWRSMGSPALRQRLLLVAGLIAGIVAANTAAQIRLNAWQGAFFDAIGQHDFAAFVAQLKVFAAIVTVLLVLVVAQTWLAERLKVRLRELVTIDLLDAWLMPRRAYLLRMRGAVGEHPDQRVHEDARHLAELATDLGVGLLQSTLLLASFVGVLWSLSADMSFTIAGRTVTVPGYMVWCALAYSLVGSVLTWIVGRPLIRLNAERYEKEGAFRFALVNIDEGAQGIVLHRVEAGERAVAGQAFEAVQAVAKRLADAVARLTWITSAYGWGTLVAPVIAAMPAYFAGNLSLGGLMMVIGAFGQVQQALRWFVDNFPRIADAGATLRRVAALRRALVGLGGDDEGGIVVAKGQDDSLVLDELALALPNGTSRLDADPVVIRPGEHVLVAGEPGCGKSTLFLALAGLWRAGRGRITVPAPADMIFLPQLPYLAHGTLREALEPGATPARDPELTRVLVRLGIGHLARDLGRTARWDRELALDEQQGLQLGWVLLQRPGWIVMDEAASAFDESRRKALLALLAKELPGSAFVVTGRLSEPDGFWTRVLHLGCVPDRAPGPRPPVIRGNARIARKRREAAAAAEHDP
jgi:putative ATP-binding cassette transporter